MARMAQVGVLLNNKSSLVTHSQPYVLLKMESVMQQLLKTPLRCMVSSVLLVGALSLSNTALAEELDFVYDDEAWDEFGENEDPWEPMNRAIFRFNETVDRWTLKPLAQG